MFIRYCTRDAQRRVSKRKPQCIDMIMFRVRNLRHDNTLINNITILYFKQEEIERNSELNEGPTTVLSEDFAD